MTKRVKSRQPVVFIPVEDDSSKVFWEESGYKLKTIHFVDKSRVYVVFPVESEEERKFLQNLYDADLKRNQRYYEKFDGLATLDGLLDEGYDPTSTEETLEDDAIDIVLLKMLMEELVTLSKEKRRIIEMVANEELEKDVAKELGIPKTTLNYRKKKLIQELREKFNI